MCTAMANLKTYPVIFLCMNTSAINLQLMHIYNTFTFLIQYQHHCAVTGRPKFVHSEPGSQIKKTSFYLANQLNLTKIVGKFPLALMGVLAAHA